MALLSLEIRFVVLPDGCADPLKCAGVPSLLIDFLRDSTTHGGICPAHLAASLQKTVPGRNRDPEHVQGGLFKVAEAVADVMIMFGT